jgi:hypothetical protein
VLKYQSGHYNDYNFQITFRSKLNNQLTAEVAAAKSAEHANIENANSNIDFAAKYTADYAYILANDNEKCTE